MVTGNCNGKKISNLSHRLTADFVKVKYDFSTRQLLVFQSMPPVHLQLHVLRLPYLSLLAPVLAQPQLLPPPLAALPSLLSAHITSSMVNSPRNTDLPVSGWETGWAAVGGLLPSCWL